MENTKEISNANVQPIVHTDVRGNKLLYVKITAKNKQVVINIGQKTFDAISKVIEPITAEEETLQILSKTGGKK